MSTIYPVFFGFKEAVEGDGYLAGVRAYCRALIEADEDGRFWASGLNPGGISAEGTTPYEAAFRLEREFRSALYALAEIAEGFEDFDRQAKALFFQEHDAKEELWEQAVAAVRAGEADLGIGKVDASTPPDLLVVDLTAEPPTRADNTEPEDVALAAA